MSGSKPLSTTISERLALEKVALDAYCRRNHIRELALFGSALRDDFGDTSDFDFLVSFQPQAQIGFLELARARRELEALLGRKVDLVPKGGLKPLIRDQVLSSARAVYEA